MADYIRVAALSDFPAENLLPVRVDGEDIVLFKVKDGVIAARDACPHAQFPLSKSFFKDKYIRCPLHYWEFNVVTGEYTHNPHIRLRMYPVKVVNGEVWVHPVYLPPPPPPPPPPSRDDA